MPTFWTLKMAWRDSRGRRGRLLLYLSSMVLGVAVLVAIAGFGDNLRRAVDEEARALLGGDLQLERGRPFSAETQALIDSIGGQQARRLSFSTMARFPETADGGRARLISVRAAEAGFPLYGALHTRPARAASTYQEGDNAVVDGVLLEQFGLGVGDSVQIGQRRYRIEGRVLEAPGAIAVTAMVSPRVYVPYGRVDSSLLGPGSRVEHEVFFKLDAGQRAERLAERLRPRLEKKGVEVRTAASTADDWQAGLRNLQYFLGLVGLVALLLGSLGVASAINVYTKKRLRTVAVLRCLGARGNRAFRIYIIQAAVMGLLSAGLGVGLGLAVQLLLPRVLADFLPVGVAFSVSWPILLWGLGVGLGAALLFALLPLLKVRRVSPLLALRSAYAGEAEKPPPDPLRGLAFGAVAAGVVGLALLQAPTLAVGLGYAAGLAVVFGVLAGVAKGLIAGARRLLPASWSYPWRQGLANLYRPGNQTLMLVLALGFGTFLILSIVFVERVLLKQIQVSDRAGQPNVVLFDVQPDQVEGVADTVRAQGLPVLDKVPIVSMRLQSVKGRSVEAMQADSSAEVEWAHTHQYRATYRGELIGSEELIAGQLMREKYAYDTSSVVPISLEEGIAGELGVGLGDTLTFDVQSVPMTTTVASLRRVDWKRLQTNFFVVFPPGALEEAPKTFVVLSRAQDETASANLQNAVVEAFPNILAIDLSLVLSVFERLFNRIEFVIRFMALFSILTGLVVLAGAVVASRYQRAEESVLLKTLGAGRRQVLGIMAIEYLFLGLFAALAGLALAVAGSATLARFVFEVPFVFAPGPILVTLAVVPGLTIGIGLLNSRGLYRRPAMEVLRAEV